MSDPSETPRPTEAHVPIDGFGRIVDAIPQCVLTIDAAGRPTFANASARRILHLARVEDLEGLALDLWEDESREMLLSDGIRIAADEGEWEGVLTLNRPDGGTVTVVASLFAHGERSDRGYSLLFADNSRSGASAGFDPLTGLAAMPSFLDRVDRELVDQAPAGQVSVLVVGLDRLRELTHTLGHDAVDELLIEAAERLRGAIRDEDALGRIESDTFAVLCSDAPDEVVDQIADRVKGALERPHTGKGRDIVVRVSIGIAGSAEQEVASEDLVRNADAARSEALRQGGSRVERFVEVLRSRATQRFEIENDLLDAIVGNQFVLHYQPEVTLRTGDVVGFEALIRWEHPEKGLVLPGAFVPIAEENGMILRMGAWVMREACRQARLWAAAHPERDLFIAVNVSPRQLSQPSIVDDFAAILAEEGADPANIQLEVTESVLVEQPELVLERISALRGLGFSVAIDDFGSGYSSLGYLKVFPVNVLKIDRALVSSITTDAKDWAIVNGVLGMAHTMGLKVLAEGIEDGRQAGALRILGCDLAQGWHFARAIPAAEAEEFLDGPPPWQLTTQGS